MRSSSLPCITADPNNHLRICPDERWPQRPVAIFRFFLLFLFDMFSPCVLLTSLSVVGSWTASGIPSVRSSVFSFFKSGSPAGFLISCVPSSVIWCFESGSLSARFLFRFFIFMPSLLGRDWLFAHLTLVLIVFSSSPSIVLWFLRFRFLLLRWFTLLVSSPIWVVRSRLAEMSLRRNKATKNPIVKSSLGTARKQARMSSVPASVDIFLGVSSPTPIPLFFHMGRTHSSWNSKWEARASVTTSSFSVLCTEHVEYTTRSTWGNERACDSSAAWTLANESSLSLESDWSSLVKWLSLLTIPDPLQDGSRRMYRTWANFSSMGFTFRKSRLWRSRLVAPVSVVSLDITERRLGSNSKAYTFLKIWKHSNQKSQ